MCKSDSLALCEVGSDIVSEDVSLLLIGSEDHDDVSLLCSLCGGVYLEAKLLDMVPALAVGCTTALGAYKATNISAHPSLWISTLLTYLECRQISAGNGKISLV